MAFPRTTTTETNPNAEAEGEACFRRESHHSLTSSPGPKATDTVDWASSQPIILESILREVAKRPDKRFLKPETPSRQRFKDCRTQSRAPTNCSYATSKNRLLRRDNLSNLRARLGPDPSNRLPNPPPAPDDSFWGKDRNAILTACQNVSERMDENVFSPTAMEDVVFSKPKTKTLYLKEALKSQASSMPPPANIRRQDHNCLEKSASWSSYASRLRQPTLLSASSSSSSSSMSSVTESSDSFLSDTSITTEPDTCDISMTMELEDKPPAIPPLSDSLGGRSLVLLNASSSHKSAPTSNHSASVAPAAKLHPLLTQGSKRPPQNSIKLSVIPPHRPGPHLERAAAAAAAPAPALLQPTCPPLLGMRRARTVSSVARRPLPLPTRQKNFKPPLLSQPASQPGFGSHLTQKPSSSRALAPLQRNHSHPSISFTASNTPGVQGKDTTENGEAQRCHTPPSSAESADNVPSCSAQSLPNGNRDADSSFDEISFDMDALEATMQLYD